MKKATKCYRNMHTARIEMEKVEHTTFDSALDCLRRTHTMSTSAVRPARTGVRVLRLHRMHLKRLPTRNYRCGHSKHQSTLLELSLSLFEFVLLLLLVCSQTGFLVVGASWGQNVLRWYRAFACVLSISNSPATKYRRRFA